MHHAVLFCNGKTDASSRRIQLLQELVKFKQNLNTFDRYDLTPLHYACHVGCLAAVRILIEAGADVNAYANKNSCMPLHFAVYTQKIEIVHELVRAGASTKAEVFCNQILDEPVKINGDPSDIARQLGNFALARYLADHSNLSSSYETLYRQLKKYRQERPL